MKFSFLLKGGKRSPVANDKVFTTVNLYESGVLDVPTAIARLKAYKTYDKLSFHTDRVMKALKFVESYVL